LQIIRAVTKLYGLSVFSPLDPEKDHHPNETLAVLFHRTAATLYFLYAIWGLTTTWSGIPTLIEANGDIWQFFFSFGVFLICVPACIGATFFPHTARLELFTGSGFIAAIIVFMAFQLSSAFQDIAHFGGFALLATILVVPLSRGIMIYRTLIKQAKDNEE